MAFPFFSLKEFAKSKSVAGLEINILPDATRIINYTLLSKKKNTISVADSQIGIADIASLKTGINNNIPLLISIHGRGVLHKKTEGEITASDGECLHKVLPNARLEDFYVQKVAGTEGSFFISVIRKDTADEILKEMKEQGFEVIGCSLGVFGIKTILSFIENQSGYYELNLPAAKLVINNGGIEKYQTLEKAEASSSVKIADESISTDTLLSFASAFQYFLPDGNFISAVIPSVAHAREEFSQKKIFQAASITAVAFFFVIFTVNLFVFNHYWTNKQELSGKVSLNQDAIQRLEKLKTEYDEKQKFFESTGLLHSSRTSFYADRIASDIPPAIRLGEMNIYPAVRKLNDENDISFTRQVINISGTCSRSTELNQWMNMLKKKEFVSEVALLGFSQDKSRESGLFNLEVKIK